MLLLYLAAAKGKMHTSPTISCFFWIVDHEVLCVLGRIDEAAAEHLVRNALVVFGAPAALAHVHGPGQRHVVVVMRADDLALLFLPAVATLQLYREQVVAEGSESQRPREAIVEQVVAVLVRPTMTRLPSRVCHW
jgi:hypothetical protein